MKLSSHLSKFSAIGGLVVALAAPLVNAAPVTLSFFGPTPETVDFVGGTNLQTIFVDGIVTVSGGHVANTSLPHMPSPTYTNDGAAGGPAGGVLRIDFSTPVSAVGVDVYFNNQPVQFRLFNSAGLLLDSSYTFPTDYTSIGGFVGLNVGSSIVSYALIDVPNVNAHDLYIDNIVYRGAQGVPDGSNVVYLVVLGLFGIVTLRRKLR